MNSVDETFRSARAVVGGLCLLLVPLVACQGDESEAGPGPLRIPSTAISVVGTSDQLALIEDIQLADDDTIWALNSTEPFLVNLSLEGEVLRVIGRAGGGPGEFSWPTTLVAEDGGAPIWVYDVGHNALIRVPDSGEPTETRRLPRDSTSATRLNSHEYLWMNNGGRTWIAGTPDGLTFAKADPALPWIYATWSTEVVRLSGDDALERVASTSRLVDTPEDVYGDARRFLPYPIWSACPSGSLALYDPSSNAVRRVDSDGRPLASYELGPERLVEITTGRVLRTVYPGVLRNRLMTDPPAEDVLLEAFRRDYEGRSEEFAKVFPEYVNLECGAGDVLWIQRFDSERGQMGRGPDWIRVRNDGSRRLVTFPEHFRPYRFAPDRVWGVHTDELGVEYVAWTALETSGP